MKNMNFRAVIQATMIVLLMDMAVGVVLLLIAGSESFRSGMSDQEINDAVQALSRSQAFLFWSLVLGTLTTAIGGYLAVRMGARKLASRSDMAPDAVVNHHYWNATGVGLLAVLLGMIFSRDAPDWYLTFGILMSLPAAIVGGYVAVAALTLQSGIDDETGPSDRFPAEDKARSDADSHDD